MINKLIRGKIIRKYKIRDRYQHIVVDGTGLVTSYEYVIGLDYEKEKINAIKYIDTKKDIEFVYITYLPITNKNIKKHQKCRRKQIEDRK